MRPIRRRFISRSVLFGIALAAASTMPAASSRMEQLMARARSEALAHPSTIVTAPTPDAFGIDAASVINLDAYEFQGADSAGDQFFDDGNGYRYLSATTSGGFIAAPARVPSGVVLLGIGVNVCAGETGSLTASLVDGGILGNPISLVGSVTTVGQSMCFEQFEPVNVEYHLNADHPLYVVIHWEGPLDGSLKFNNVFLAYRRLVSPAPATATFGDVPTSHPFFQFIEALAAAGVTGGCGNGNFCPDAPLTRGQMAVFLAKALGLHWPG
jgi:S-layer homology domain